jgi:hypothetical protein
MFKGISPELDVRLKLFFQVALCATAVKKPAD